MKQVQCKTLETLLTQLVVAIEQQNDLAISQRVLEVVDERFSVDQSVFGVDVEIDATILKPYFDKRAERIFGGLQVTDLFCIPLNRCAACEHWYGRAPA